MTIRYVERNTGELRTEPVLWGGVFPWLYSDRKAARVLRAAVRVRLVSRVYGWLQTRPSRPERIATFIREAGIDAAEAELDATRYATISSYFSRGLKPGARPVANAPDTLVAPADGRALVFPCLEDQALPIKGRRVPLAAVLGDEGLARRFRGGAAAVIRLAPGDYHRFHFPEDGEASPWRDIPGRYDSVNHYALARDPQILCRNHRHVTRLFSKTFGELLLVEIGALFAGAIVQTYRSGPVRRGDEKGYFRPGGSTVVIVAEPDRLLFDEDLGRHSAAGYETRIRMGTSIGRRVAA